MLLGRNLVRHGRPPAPGVQWQTGAKPLLQRISMCAVQQHKADQKGQVRSDACRRHARCRIERI
jgi:hypothetical protein